VREQLSGRCSGGLQIFRLLITRRTPLANGTGLKEGTLGARAPLPWIGRAQVPAPRVPNSHWRSRLLMQGGHISPKRALGRRKGTSRPVALRAFPRYGRSAGHLLLPQATGAYDGRGQSLSVSSKIQGRCGESATLNENPHETIGSAAWRYGSDAPCLVRVIRCAPDGRPRSSSI
jgi:hypothetical protein